MKCIFKQPAMDWHEGFPVGNGRLGALVYCGPNMELLQINEDTLWSGYPVLEQKGFSAEVLEAAGKLTESRNYGEAMHLLEDAMKDTEDVQMYEPFGTIKMEFLDRREITDYHRHLDLETALVEVVYRNQGAEYRHTCFSSAPAQGIIYRIVSEESFSIKLYGEGGFLTEAEYSEDGFLLQGQCPGRSGFTKGTPLSEAEPYFSENPEERGIFYKGRGKITVKGGTTEATENGVICRDITELVLFLAVRSSFNGYNRHPFTDGKNPEEDLAFDIKQADKAYSVLLKEHIEDYQMFFSRVKLGLKAGGREEMDLKERLRLFEKEPYDQSLQTLLFDYGRYLLISASRPGTQAANLQGIWNRDKVPAWFCDYTVNINTEMNYWLTGPCNLPELMEPFVRLNKEIIENGRKTARDFYGCQGSAAFHNVDIWRKTSPADGKAMWAFWPFGAAWMCRNLYDCYLFTQDTEYLKEIMPILKENVLFCEQMMTKTPQGYAPTPATSPENEFLWDDERVSVANYTENTLAIIRNLFRDYIQVCETLGEQDDISETAVRLLSDLIPTAIGSKGQILEWEEEFEEADLHHRHLSHLYELHPGCGITRKTPGLFKAAETSLIGRGEAGTGWSLAWKILMWARLEDGRRAEQIVNNLFHLVDPDNGSSSERGGLYPNLFCACPPFQIDGNLGYTAGIAEMLLQSHTEEIVLLPALPEAWDEGRVSGLVARGGISVNMEWSGNTVKYSMVSERDCTVFVRVRNQSPELLMLKSGVKLEQERELV